MIMFGFEASPHVFTKILRAVCKYLRVFFVVILLTAYLDDFLIPAESAQTCTLHTEITILMFRLLGLLENS